jgi:hypothetical protein
MLRPEYSLTLAILNNLNNLFFKKKKIDKTEAIYQQTLTEMKKTLESEYL